MTINNDLCRVLQVGLTVKLLLLFPGLLPGHDFLVKPAKTTAAKGTPLEVSVLLTEIFMQPDRVLPESAVELHAVANGVRTPIPLKADEQAKALVGTLRSPSAKAFILSGHRLASIRSGANRKGAPPAGAGSAGAVKSESFSKALINTSAGDNGYAAIVGDRLEIVPVTNPALVQAGGEMTVQIRFDGKPLKTKVLATYDGFSAEPHKVTRQLDSGEDGTARFQVANPGLWMVRAAQSLEEPAETHSRYVAAATLIFSVE
jgi:uncharacterized GH25 family protein